MTGLVTANSTAICCIGLGEVGRRFSRDLIANCGVAIAAYDSSLGETLPSIDWRRFAGDMGERVAAHGLRRAAGKREAADMLAEMGLEPGLARAVGDAQQRDARPGLSRLEGV